MAEHAEAKRKASTAREYRRLLDHVVLPAIGKRKVANVTRQDVTKFHYARRETPIEANHALAVASALFNFAERIGCRPDGGNPCRHVEKYPQRNRERFLSADELARLGDALAAYDGSPYATAAIKLLVFTGARLGEVLGLQWQWIDFDRGEARLPDSKSGPKTIHLPPPALAVLTELPRVEGNPHVIVGGVPGAGLVNLEKPWRAIRKKAELEDVRLHDLRHAFASIAVSSGMGLPIIGKMLGHTQAQTTQRYAHLARGPGEGRSRRRRQQDRRGNGRRHRRQGRCCRGQAAPRRIDFGSAGIGRRPDTRGHRAALPYRLVRTLGGARYARP
jgi:integrase